MTETTHTYQLTGYSPAPSNATVTVQSFDRAERVRRALKGLGKFWAFAVGSVFIPVAHFLLVPGFALFGAYTFFERLGAREIATTAEGTCPDCGRIQKLETGGGGAGVSRATSPAGIASGVSGFPRSGIPLPG